MVSVKPKYYSFRKSMKGILYSRTNAISNLHSFGSFVYRLKDLPDLKLCNCLSYYYHLALALYPSMILLVSSKIKLILSFGFYFGSLEDF
jgi:hypothetical protein